MRILTCDPEVETIGNNMLSLIDNLQADDIYPLLEKHNLTEIDPNAWYPAQRWMDVLNDMMQEPGATGNLVAVGMAVSERITLPPDMTTLEQVLKGWDILYHLQHRGGNIGYVAFEKRSPSHFVSIHDHLYPDDFTYGLAYGFARRLLPSGTSFTVEYDRDEVRKDMGGDRTLIHVIWE